MKDLKWVFQTLIIALLAVGCISPISLQTTESTPQSTVETPAVTSSPDHLPEDKPTVTPRPGWTVYDEPKLDITFQLPEEWQRVERNGAGHQFEGASGYISFSDLLPPMIFDKNVERICQKEIESGDEKYQILDQKPFGEHPQVINVQVDHQPACLVLPSRDQDQQFEKHSILYARYPRDLALKPERPRFLTIDSDKDHIQSIAETVHFTAAPLVQTPSLVPTNATMHLSPPTGATLTGRVITGYGDHLPVDVLPLRVRRESQEGRDTHTDANGYFTLTDLPAGRVDIDDGHLSIWVTIDSPTQCIDLGKVKYPMVHPPPYYYWQAAPLADPGQLLRDGKAVAFEVCAADSKFSTLAFVCNNWPKNHQVRMKI
jgi:hypothetical protein